MPVYRGFGLSVLFVHIPKTGGTSIEALFRRAGFEQSYFSGTERHPGFGVYPQHLTALQLAEEFPNAEFDFAFMIVRDPIARLGSERAYRARLRESRNRPPIVAYDLWTRRMLARSAEDPSHFDNHFRPQVEFLLPDTTVFRFEDGIDNVHRSLATTLGVPALAEQDTPKTQVGHRSTDRSFEDLEPSTRNEFIRRYLADFAAFDYPLPPSAAVPRISASADSNVSA